MKRHRHIRRRLVGALAAFVVFCTTYALILPAVTLSGETHCGKEEHTHTEDCYRSEDWLCGLEEQTATEGHVHDQTCWQTQETLICGQEESELHVHDATCYQTEQVLICGQKETAEVQGHTHTDDCHKSSEPLCGKEEHIHTRQCQSDPAAVETEEDWKKSIPTDLKEEVRERVLQVAESQLGYRESEKNFRVNEDGTEDGFTRYGVWAGDCYGDWNNAFTGFVLKYAQADGGFNRDINQWIVEQSQNLNTAYETAEPGQVVFYQDDEGQRKSGILESYDAKSQQVRIYAGDVEKSVKKIDRTAAQMIGTLPVSDKNTAGPSTEETDSAAGPADENPENPDADLSVKGDKTSYRIGEEATLSVQAATEEKLYYQWQYSEGNIEEESSWRNIPGATGKDFSFQINEENSKLYYRAQVSNQPIITEDDLDERELISNFSSEIVANPMNTDETMIEATDPIQISIEQEPATDTATLSANNQLGTDITNPDDVLHTKTIEYRGLGTDPSLKDSYRLNLTAGPIAGDSPVDLLFVIDESGSMKKEINKKQTRIEALKTTLNTVTESFLECNEQNRVAFVSFGSIVFNNECLDWTSDKTTVQNAITKLNANHSRPSVKKYKNGYFVGKYATGDGTNYVSALNEATNKLNQAVSGHKKYVIFLSDGLPTFYPYSDGVAGNGNDDKNGTADATNKAINTFKTKWSSIVSGIATIQYGQTESNDYLNKLQTDGKYDSQDVESLNSTLRLLSQGISCSGGEIKDTLSDNMQFDLENLDVRVMAHKSGIVDETHSVKIFQGSLVSDGSIPNTISDSTTIDGVSGKIAVSTMNPQVSLSGDKKTISLKFSESWKMDPSYLYEFSFNVSEKEAAYLNSAREYPNTGDSNTGEISSEKRGVHSNATAVLNFVYTDKNGKEEQKSLPYPKPVAQIVLSDLIIQKASNNQSVIEGLNGATFKLFKADSTGATIDGISEKVTVVEHNQNLISENGQIVLTKLFPGTYYLVEAKAPDGYLMAVKPWRIELSPYVNQQSQKIEMQAKVIDQNTGDEKVLYLAAKLRDINGKNSEEHWKFINNEPYKALNEPGKPLPNTGGTGTQLLTSAGAAMIAGSLLVYGYRKRLRGKEGRSK